MPAEYGAALGDLSQPPGQIAMLGLAPRQLERASIRGSSLLVGLAAAEDELPERTGPSSATRVLQEHQREQPESLCLVRHEHGQELPEPDRLLAELPADDRLARSGGVTLVEDEIQDREHGAQPLRQQV